MTDDDWLASHDAEAMLRVVQCSNPSERKVRLFNAAVCRRFWGFLPAASRAILVKSELIADGLIRASSDDMELCGLANEVVAICDRRYPNKVFPSREVRIQRDAAAAVCYAVTPNELWGAASYLWELDPAERDSHSTIIRDVFGTPSCSVTLDPSWLAPAVVSLAQTIYDARSFERLPELAHALGAAGCTNNDILDHCRNGGHHVRGCWVVDLILGKE